jgi:arylsulfatase A-like enzyme
MVKNVILVTVDSLRADVCFGEDGDRLAPNINQIGREGIKFESAYAPGPRTPSSVPAFLTGEFYQTKNEDVSGWRNGIRSHVVPTETIPEVFSKKGYSTLGFSFNPWTSSDTGFDIIFDEFYELTPESNTDINASPLFPGYEHIDNLLRKTSQENLFNWDTLREWFTHWASLKSEIFEGISCASEPYFVWIFLMDTHQPTIVPKQYRMESGLFRSLYAINYFTNHRGESLPNHVDRWIKKSYRDSVRSVDYFVGELIKNIGVNDVVAVHSDHGEAWGEHGINGHEYQLYEENIRVPMVIRHPNISENVSGKLSLLDLPFLLLELSKEQSSDLCQWERQFVPTMIENIETAKVRSKIGYNPHFRALRGDRFKYIETQDDDLLFDLNDCPNETNSVISEFPEMADTFQQLLDYYSRKREEKHRIVERVDELDLSSY